MKIKLIIICLISIFLTGCFNYRELSELGITSAIGIEKINDDIKVTIQVLDTNKNGNSNDNTPKYVIYTSTGKTIQEALRNVVNDTSKRLYINHTQVLIIDEKLAQTGINDIIDFFFRDPESRKQFLVLIARDKVEDILSTKTLLEEINGESIKESTNTNYQYLGSVKATTFGSLMADYVNKRKSISLPSIALIKENNGDSTIIPNKRIILTDTGVFKGDKLIGYISGEDMIYYNLIKNNIDNTIITKELDGKFTSIEISNNKASIKTSGNNININLKMKGNITDINYDIDLSNKDNISYLQELFANELNKKIKDSITNTIDKYDTDIYGFKDLFYKNNRKDIELKDMNINITSNIELTSKGNGVDNIDKKG